MEIISKDTLINLIENRQGKAVSIFLPTFVSAREARKNPIRLKNLITQVEDQMGETGMGKGEIESYLSPLMALVEDTTFWQDQSEGLALFLDANELRIFTLPKRFEDFSVVGEEFYITPLIPLYQGNGEYFLLYLDQKKPRIYQGSKYQLNRIDDLDLPDSLQEMLDKFYEFHKHSQFHSKTSTPNPDLAMERGGTFFGHGGDDIDEDAEIRNYFHRFDEALMAYIGDEDIPLVLAGLGYLHPLYREANSYPNLVKEGIEKDVVQMSIEELHQITWEIVEDHYQMDVDQALGVYHNLADKDGETTQEIAEIVPAAYFKRIHTLFLAEDSQIWGYFDQEENQVIIDEKKTPDNDDLLSMAAGKTLINGGNVLVLPRNKVPEQSKAAAILRY